MRYDALGSPQNCVPADKLGVLIALFAMVQLLHPQRATIKQEGSIGPGSALARALVNHKFACTRSLRAVDFKVDVKTFPLDQ